MSRRRWRRKVGTTIGFGSTRPGRRGSRSPGRQRAARRRALCQGHRANRKRRRCTRFVAAGSFTLAAKQGANSLRFLGRLDRPRGSPRPLSVPSRSPMQPATRPSPPPAPLQDRPAMRGRIPMRAPLAAFAALLLLPAASPAATIFGSRLNHDPTTRGCKGTDACTLTQFIVPTDPNGDPDAERLAVSGVITKFRVRAFAVDQPGTVTLRVGDISRPNPSDQSTARGHRHRHGADRADPARSTIPRRRCGNSPPSCRSNRASTSRSTRPRPSTPSTPQRQQVHLQLRAAAGRRPGPARIDRRDRGAARRR